MVFVSLSNVSACVLLASYNGQPYLSAQLESIFQQITPGWHVYIRDDLSSDNTVEAISHYFERGECVWLRDNSGRLKSLGNFSLLMQKAYEAGEKYFFLSDQDDVWVNYKLALQMMHMQEMEHLYPGKPILVHSDLEVVDVSLNIIDASFMRYQGIRHEPSNPLHVLLAQNFVTGCTVMINRSLLDIALPIPEHVVMHDWWLALCAAVFGHIGYIDEPLVKYRQHGNNEVGAKHLADFLNPVSGKWKQRWKEGRDNLFQSMKQAQALAKRIRECDPDNKYLSLVEAYAALQYDNPMRRVRKIRALGIHAQSTLRQGLLLSRLLLSPGHSDG